MPHLDLNLHIGDVIALAGLGLAAWQRVSTALRGIEQFMRDSREDRLSLHRRIDLIEYQIRHIRGD